MELARSDQCTGHRGSGQVADAFKAHVLLGKLLGIRVADYPGWCKDEEEEQLHRYLLFKYPRVFYFI